MPRDAPVTIATFPFCVVIWISCALRERDNAASACLSHVIWIRLVRGSDRLKLAGTGTDAPVVRRSDQQGATVDHDHLASAVAFPHQIEISVGEIIRLADTTDRKALRNVSIQGVTIGFGHVVPQFRPDYAGTPRSLELAQALPPRRG